jgi:putative ABC transport system permease protein
MLMLSRLGETLRGLRRRPGPTLAAIVTLAFAIGLFAAMVGVVQAFVFRPLMVHDVDRVVRVRERINAGVDATTVNPSPAVFEAWRSKQTVFEDMAAATAQSVALQGELENEAAPAGMVSANFFHVLGIAPQLGRDFSAGEDRSGHDGVVLLSDETWHTRFNGDPSIIGRTLRIDGQSRLVIGVMPANFSHPYDAKMWLPLRWDEMLRSSTGNFLYVPARLRAGITIAQAQLALDATAQAIHVAQPELGQADASNLVSVRDETLGDLSATLWILFASACFVLLVATLNTATVFYAQAIADARSTVMRVALGAGNRALFARALMRSGFVVGFATALGLAASLQFYAPLLALSGGSALKEFDAVVRLDAPTLAWICITAVVLAVALALLDLRHAHQLTSSAGFSTRGASSDRGTRRRLSVATIAQCAMSFVLAAAGVFVTLGYKHLADMDRGYRSDKILLADLAFPAARYPNTASRNAFMDRLLGELKSQPDIEAAGASTVTPDYQGDWAASFVVPGRAPLPQPGYESTNHRLITPGYFQTLGIALLGGRDFDALNPARDAACVIVSQSFAKHAWGDENPLGKTLTRLNGRKQVTATLTVIGIAADVVEAVREPFAPAQRSWYMSTAAGTDYDYSEITLAIRARNDPAQLAAGLRQTMARLDPELAAAHVLPMSSRLAESLRREKLSSFLYTLFAGCALSIALCGLYGALAFLVETSRREFGVRLALGALPSEVLRHILRRGLTLAIFGVGIGVALALPALKLIGALVQGATPADAWALIPLIAMMLALALAAGLLPAQRASRVDPIEALRSE